MSKQSREGRQTIRDAMNESLRESERTLLELMQQSELWQYGEVCGGTLDALIAKGLVEVLGEETETQNPFIAKGKGIMYRAVKVTDAGRAIEC